MEQEFVKIFEDDNLATEMKLSYGNIAKRDIPLVMDEPIHHTYARFGTWFGFLVFGAIFLIFIMTKEANARHKLRNITAKYLADERDNQLSMQNRITAASQNLLVIPYAKYIDIFIPKTCLVDATNPTNYLDHLFTFYIVSKAGTMSQVQSDWQDLNQIYFIRFTLPQFMQLRSLMIYTSPTEIFTSSVANSINTISINLRDMNDTIIWKEIITVDFADGYSSTGLINGKYLTIQFA